MPDATIATLRDQFHELRTALTAPDAPARRDALKGAIIALYRASEREMGGLGMRKDEGKGLAQH